VILPEGYVPTPGESLLAPQRYQVSAGYFEAIGARLVRGRFFDASDTADAPRTVIVDERLARRFWPDRDPIGRRLYLPTDVRDLARITEETEFMTVVGLIQEIRTGDPRLNRSPVGAYYFPVQQSPNRTAHLAVRTTQPDPNVMSGLRQAMSTVDPELPLYSAQTLESYIDRGMAGRRVPVAIASAFGGVGLLLATLGIYGVLAYGVSERRRELGVRLALGGSPASVFRLVLGEGLAITAAGLGLGLSGAWLVGRLMTGLLYDVAPIDPRVYTTVASALLLTAIVASALPSWRAARIAPAEALS
jgi:hypothetical protein